MGGCATEEGCDPPWVWADSLLMRTDLGEGDCGGRKTSGEATKKALGSHGRAGVQTRVVAVLGTCGWIWSHMQSPGVVGRPLRGSAPWLSLWGTALCSLLSPLMHHSGNTHRIPACCSVAEAMGAPHGRDLWRVLCTGSLQKKKKKKDSDGRTRSPASTATQKISLERMPVTLALGPRRQALF